MAKVVKEVSEEEKRRQALMEARPSLDSIINMHDFEVVAKTVLPEKAWVRDLVPRSPCRMSHASHSGLLFLSI